MKPTWRKDPVWWNGCAFCPDDSQPQNGHHAGFNNAFRADSLTVVVLYGRRRPRLRRVHLLCLPFALAAGATMPPLVAPAPAVQISLLQASA
jgi:hypothetical protein